MTKTPKDALTSTPVTKRPYRKQGASGSEPLDFVKLAASLAPEAPSIIEIKLPHGILLRIPTHVAR